MRLTSTEVMALISSLETYLSKDFKGELLLFGSRTNDFLKGGDIDLALLIEFSPHLRDLNLNSHKITAAMKMHADIGDRRIDLKIIDKNIPKSAFLTEALKSTILLKQWT